MGLIARTLDGNDVLNSHGWITNIFNEASNMSETTLRGNNQSVVCIPEDVEKFFSVLFFLIKDLLDPILAPYLDVCASKPA